MIKLRFPKTPEFIQAAITYLKTELSVAHSGCGQDSDNPMPDGVDYSNNNPVPEAPTPPANQTPPSDVDADGLPWDERINTANYGQTAKGVWKRKPGLTDEFVESVKAELRGVSTPPAAQTPPAAPAAPGIPTTYIELTQYVTGNGLITQATEAVKKLGLATYAQLAARTELIPLVYEEIKS